MLLRIWHTGGVTTSDAICETPSALKNNDTFHSTVCRDGACTVSTPKTAIPFPHRHIVAGRRGEKQQYRNTVKNGIIFLIHPFAHV